MPTRPETTCQTKLQLEDVELYCGLSIDAGSAEDRLKVPVLP